MAESLKPEPDSAPAASASAVQSKAGDDTGKRRAIVARALPFASYIALLALGGWLSPSLPPALQAWMYPLQIGLTGFALCYFWSQYGELRGASPTAGGATHWLIAFVIGVLVFISWIHLDLPYLSFGQSGGDALRQGGEAADWRWLAVRLFGAAIVVPLMEELFWRSLVMRWIDRPDFLRLTPATVSLRAMVLSSLAFGFEHQLWFAGVLAGLAYAWLYRRSGCLWHAVFAHGVTNLLLGLWVIQTGNWQFW